MANDCSDTSRVLAKFAYNGYGSYPSCDGLFKSDPESRNQVYNAAASISTVGCDVSGGGCASCHC